tara:strand:- start:90 stop:233 length:144 start_codon:yes stop_codon:yes gene_type:complete
MHFCIFALCARAELLIKNTKTANTISNSKLKGYSTIHFLLVKKIILI